MSRMTRRTFLWLTGGSGLALATDVPRKAVNRLIPQVIPPEQIKPGEWVRFATTCRECPAGCGLHVLHRDGRVTKVEGNPEHPVNRGALCSRGQSSVQGLYDPDRVRTVIRRPQRQDPIESGWEPALQAIAARLAAGDRAVLISNLQTGALAEVMNAFAAAFRSPVPLWYEPFSYEPLRIAHRQLYGHDSIPAHLLEGCELVLSFGADFLETWISPVSYARQFGRLRGIGGSTAPGRFVYVGPRLSMTAANADQFIQVPPGFEAEVAVAVLRIIAARGWGRVDLSAVGELAASFGPGRHIPGVSDRALAELARNFAAARSAIALAGPSGAGPWAARTAAAAMLINHICGQTGRTVDFTRPHALSRTASDEALHQALSSLGPRDILFIHDANPLYSRPMADRLLQQAGTVVCLGTMMDETARSADWFLPVDSPLEGWGEYEPEQGVLGLLQPTLGRLYDSRAAGDIFVELARRTGRSLAPPGGAPPTDFKAWLRQRWSRLAAREAPGIEPQRFWKAALRRGGFWRGGVKGAPPKLIATGRLRPPPPQPPVGDPGQAVLWLWPSLTLHDGRLANRGWLQEAPDPITFIVWGNWIDIHPAQARALGLEDGEVAELATPGASVRAPVRITGEVAEQTVALAFGHGHQGLGRLASGVGANAFLLLDRTAGTTPFGICSIRRVGPPKPPDPVVTAPSSRQFERGILQWASWSTVRKMRPGEGEELAMPLPEGYRPGRDIYPPREYLQHRWAMVIDLQRCIGCGACAVACYAENNIPVIGREQVGNGREMAWLRVVPYRRHDNDLRLGWLPMLCQHCDAAPCEPVCPVFAAVHNEEGLNAQIYNRCIGTRYCSNNCPYKVRRFNWNNVTWRSPLDLQLNPEVTVRVRGVMEKCTFCVQRIRQAEYRALLENRMVADGEIRTACMQTCPTGVFSFGDLLDPQSEVSRLTRSDPRRYHVLEELNTKPAVTYLRRIDLDG